MYRILVSKTQTTRYNPARSTTESMLAEDPYLKQQQTEYRNLVDVYLDQIRRFPRLDASQETLLASQLSLCRRQLQSDLLKFPIVALWMVRSDLPRLAGWSLPALSLDKHLELKPWIDRLRQICSQSRQDVAIDVQSEFLKELRITVAELDKNVELPADWLEKAAAQLLSDLSSKSCSTLLFGVADPQAGFSQLAQTYQSWQRVIYLLVQANLRLVVHHALRYRRQRDSLLLDLIQEGNLGLLRAARKFDIRMGCRFSTYASFWIRLFIDRAAVRHQGAVQRPLKIGYLMRRLCLVLLKLEHTQREQWLSRSLGDTNLCPSQLDDWLQFEQAVLSFETWLEDGGKEFAEQLSQSDDSLWQEYFLEQLHQAIRESLKILSNREKQILQYRFGLGNQNPVTLQYLANHLGISRERVRQIEASALRKLRNRFASKWREFL